MGSDNEYEHQSSAKPVSKWSNHMDNKPVFSIKLSDRNPLKDERVIIIDGVECYSVGNSTFVPNPLFYEQVTNKNNI